MTRQNQSIPAGGSGKATAQDAINALTGAAGAFEGQVLSISNGDAVFIDSPLLAQILTHNGEVLVLNGEVLWKGW